MRLWRRHGLFVAAGALCVLVNWQGLGPLWYVGVTLLLVGIGLGWALRHRQRPVGERDPVPVEIPVSGRWKALNGPGTKVPSHHTHSHAQTYAIDLTCHPLETPAPEPRWFWPVARRPDRYPAFGQPVLAPGDGVVVTRTDGQRDHLSRTSLPGLFYLFAEGFLRSMGWTRHLWGNHLVLDLGNGTYAGFAHLRQGSALVTIGEHVTTGQHLAECGNSGNSSEPHVHFQLMNGPDPTTAQGLPFTWHYTNDQATPQTGVPQNTTHFTPTPTPTPTTSPPTT